MSLTEQRSHDHQLVFPSSAANRGFRDAALSHEANRLVCQPAAAKHGQTARGEVCRVLCSACPECLLLAAADRMLTSTEAIPSAALSAVSGVGEES